MNDSATAPRFWMHETSGVLRRVVTAYLADEHLTPDDIKIMRDYLKQWIDHPGWHGGLGLARLRERVGFLASRDQIHNWLDEAERMDLDPL